MAVITLNITKEDRILIIAPHPDDECIGAGGILSAYPEICDVVLLTDGRQGQKNVSPDVEKEVRAREFENEMKYAKVHSYKMLEYEDGTMMQHLDCLKELDLSVYTKIFVPWGNDNHPDHTAGYLCAMQRIREQRLTKVEVYQYEVHVPFHDVTHMLDITAYIENKIRLIRFHESQIAASDFDKRAKALGKYRACQCNASDKYWETYVQVDIGCDSFNLQISNREKDLQKYIQFYRVLIRWIKSIQEGYSIVDYLNKKGITCVAIYGYSDLGKLLHKELMRSNIRVEAILDKRDIGDAMDGIPVMSPLKYHMKADAILVTAIFYFDEIKQELQNMGFLNVISLEKILEDLI